MAHALDDLSVLDQYASSSFPPGYPTDRRSFFSPVDNVHGALVAVIGSAERSLLITMYGFDDDELADLVVAHLRNPSVYVQLTLDSSQAGGVHEKALLAREQFPASTIAIGRSEKGGIIHLKEAVIDGVVALRGSTNWSTSGETLQDNEIVVTSNPAEAAVVAARLGAIHAYVLQKAGAQ